MSSPEEDEVQQQNTTLSFTSISKEQTAEATVIIG